MCYGNYFLLVILKGQKDFIQPNVQLGLRRCLGATTTAKGESKSKKEYCKRGNSQTREREGSKGFPKGEGNEARKWT
jgi:hypothetical protein